MTRTEQAELQELGMTPERLAENQAKVAAILHGDKPQVQAFEYSEAKPPKKRRSDAGVPRKPRTQPSEQAPGVLTREQANKLVELIEEKERRHVVYEAAQTHAEKCDKALASADEDLAHYIDSLTGGA